MILLSTSGVITPSQSKSNLILPFAVSDKINSITVNYTYSPKTIDDKMVARNEVANALIKYRAENIAASQFFPVKNLVTLSFDENGKYRGACHRQANKQRIIIASDDSTPGIINREITPGEWDVCLNIHYIGCDVNYNIEIIGEEL